MEVDAASPASGSYTILRIKRKRNEEPLDALVVESRVRRKKSRGGIGVFQFAQTVENDAWEDEKRQKVIQEQISQLARENAVNIESKAPEPASGPTSVTHPRQQKDDAKPRYTILKQGEDEPPPRRYPTNPPKVISAKDLPPKALVPDFKMYDAVLAADKPISPPVDSEMDKFLPMLNDYLKLHDFTADSTPAPASTQKPVAVKASTSTSASSSLLADDYVWDVFYHRPATLSEWNEAANIGTLTGPLPTVLDPYDSDSDSEEEDEADEDSNAEEYYKNEYPEDEDSTSDDSTGSDGFHEDSDHDDLMHYEDDGSDHEWR